MINENEKKALESQLEAIINSIDNSYLQTINGSIDIKDLTEEQINDLKKIIAVSIVTANDKGSKVTDSKGEAINCDDPIKVANSASDTIEILKLAFDAACGNFESLKEILVYILDYVTVKLVTNARWMAENGLPIAIESLKITSYSIDGFLPGVGEVIRSVLEFAENYNDVILNYLTYALTTGIPSLSEKIKRFIINKPSNPTFERKQKVNNKVAMDF